MTPAEALDVIRTVGDPESFDAAVAVLATFVDRAQAPGVECHACGALVPTCRSAWVSPHRHLIDTTPHQAQYFTGQHDHDIAIPTPTPHRHDGPDGWHSTS